VQIELRFLTPEQESNLKLKRLMMKDARRAQRVFKAQEEREEWVYNIPFEGLHYDEV